MSLSLIDIIVNSALLIAAFIVAVTMLQAGARYTYHYGDTPKQEPYRWRILWLILILVAIGLIASIYNIALPYFM